MKRGSGIMLTCLTLAGCGVLKRVFLWRDTQRLDPYKPLPGWPME